MSLVRRGLTGVIVDLWRMLRNSVEVIIRTSHLLLHNITSQSNDNAIQNESKWEFQWHKSRKVDSVSQNKPYDEPEWRSWPGSTL